MKSTRTAITALIALALFAGACTKAIVIPVYIITASEPGTDQYHFDVPAGINAGVITFRLVNQGKSPHDFQLAKATSGHTLSEFVGLIADPEAKLTTWLEAAGGVGTTLPGQTREATLDLKPGTYWYVCTESDDSKTPTVYHASHGMSGESAYTTVSGAKLPTTTGTIVARDYNFTTTGLKAGHNTVTFSNASPLQLHHVVIVPIVAGKTLDDVKKAFTEQNPTGPPPIDFEKAIVAAVVNPGDKEVFSFDLVAGTKYALVCFMPDRGTSGPPHAIGHNMISEEDVK